MRGISERMENYSIDEFSNESIKTTAEILSQLFKNISYPSKSGQEMSIENLDISPIGDDRYLVYVDWNYTSLNTMDVKTTSVTYLLKKGKTGFEVISAISNNEQLNLRENGYIE